MAGGDSKTNAEEKSKERDKIIWKNLACPEAFAHVLLSVRASVNKTIDLLENWSLKEEYYLMPKIISLLCGHHNPRSSLNM